MKNSEYKKEASKTIKGKWNQLAVSILIYYLIMLSLEISIKYFSESNMILSSLFAIITLAVTIPLTYGLVTSFMKLKRTGKYNITDFITIAFDNFAKAWGLFLRILLKLLLPIIAIIISSYLSLQSVFLGGINQNNLLIDSLAIFFTILSLIALIWLACRSLFYSLTYIVAYDNKKSNSKTIINKTSELLKIKNTKSNLILLGLSFVGWFIAIGIIQSIFLLTGFKTFPILIALISKLWLVPYIYFSVISFYDNLLKLSNNKENKSAEETKKSVKSKPNNTTTKKTAKNVTKKSEKNNTKTDDSAKK